MVFPHKLNSTRDISVIQLSGTNADGDVTVALNIPPGRLLVAMVLRTTGTTTGTIFSLKQYVNEAQTEISTEAVSMALATSGVPVTTVTVPLGTNGEHVHIYPAGSLLAPPGNYSIYGFAVVVNITGAGGDWAIDAICTGG